jgi:hypothetical protein
MGKGDVFECSRARLVSHLLQRRAKTGLPPLNGEPGSGVTSWYSELKKPLFTPE